MLRKHSVWSPSVSIILDLLNDLNHCSRHLCRTNEDVNVCSLPYRPHIPAGADSYTYLVMILCVRKLYMLWVVIQGHRALSCTWLVHLFPAASTLAC